ncbi:hypothetical protein LMH87_003015 [Akanthomyces muscarius]|uniref:Uncharacterized protein n=1 Tax=Akanthomyces muscarius TaxID=2231603 RepID=A0A9W8Q9I7_AKAMU|nr:hypothetical protein LMH87_003015 [Akanthomyces muscarius]KAJ4148550.1 hypothetical protein LMH87_003015 [Akanthomyces muscarius]
MGWVPNLATRRFFSSPQETNPGLDHCGIDSTSFIPLQARKRNAIRATQNGLRVIFLVFAIWVTVTPL